MNVHKKLSLVILLSLVLPGCLFKKDGVELDKKSKKSNGKSLAYSKGGKRDEGKFFDESVEAFVLEEDDGSGVTLSKFDAAEEMRLARADVSGAAKDSFEKIYFDFDKQNIRPDQEPTLAYDVQRAKEVAPKAKIIVAGHSDSHFVSEAYNIAKSELRARAVAKEIEKAGVPRSKISVIGYGDKKPAVAVSGKEERNRRVEIAKLAVKA